MGVEMELIADFLLVAGSLGAALYCYTLGRKLRKFNNLESGMGGAVAVLSAQVDDLEKTLNQSKQAAAYSAEQLSALTDRAEDVKRQLELQIAALHDVVPKASRNGTPLETGSAPEPAVSAQPASDGSQPIFVRRRI